VIDPCLFSVERLLATLLDDRHGNRDAWRKHAEIVTEYISPHAPPGTPGRCVVRFGSSFLRHSKGPGQGHSWDCYGDDYLYPELALLALCAAPVPPGLLPKRMFEPAGDLPNDTLTLIMGRDR